MKLEVVALSDLGSVRGNNEDNLYHDGRVKEDVTLPGYEYHGEQTVEAGSAYAVFDGMGGLAHGEAASLTAALRLKYILERKKVSNYEALIHDLNRMVCKKQKEFHTQIGTTAAIVCFGENSVAAANVGDTRIYFWRDGRLKQLSRDHTERNSVLEMQKEFGNLYQIDPSKVKDALTQHLGIEEDEFILEPEVKRIKEVRANDIILLCSDGLWNGVSDEEIEEILRKEKDLPEAAKSLRDQALWNYGKDNITMILLKVLEGK